MRPVHSNQMNHPSLPTGSVLGVGMQPYGSLVMGSAVRDCNVAPLPVGNAQETHPNRPPVYFMPAQSHMNVLNPGGNVVHPPQPMYYREQPSVGGYMAYTSGTKPSMSLPANHATNPTSVVNQHCNDYHQLHLGSDLFSYFSSQPLRTLPEIRAAPLSTIDQVHPPAVQRGPTVYIGHLTPDTDDVIIRQLLQECGRVLRWSRTTDPATKKLSSFGFCEFESPLGVTRAVRCLNGLVLDGQALVANCEDKVKEGMEQWRNDRKNKLQEENPAKSIQEIEHEIEKEELRTTATTQRIAAEWNAKSASQRLAESCQMPDVVAPSTIPPSQIPSATLESDGPTVVEPLVKKSVETKQDSPLPQRVQYLNALPGYVDVPSHITLSNRESIRIRQWNGTVKDARAQFRKYCQAWERKEQYLRKDRQRAEEETKIALKNPSKLSSSQKDHLIEKDLYDMLYYLAPNGTLWEGRLSSRRADERVMWLKKEKERDEQDRLEEINEIREKAKELAILAAKKALTSIATENQTNQENQRDTTSCVDNEKPEKEKVEKIQDNQESIAEHDLVVDSTKTKEENRSNDKQRSDSPHQNEDDDKEGAAPMKLNLFQTCTLKDGITTGDVSRSNQGYLETTRPAVLDLQLLSSTKKASAVRDKAVTSSVSNVFNLGDDDDEDNEGGSFKSRTKRPLPPLGNSIDSAKRNVDNITKPLPSEEKRQELVKRLAAQIPQTTEELFRFPIDWNLLKTNDIFEAKVTPWINKKIVEFLGEEEPELTVLLSTKIMMEPDPHVFLEKLKEFFDEDAKGFTVKLWKMLVFEVLRLRQSATNT